MALSYDINSRSMDEIQQEGAWYSDLVPSDDTDDWDAKNLKAFGEDIAWVQRLDEKPLDPTDIQYTVRASPLHDEVVFDDTGSCVLQKRSVIGTWSISERQCKIPAA